MAGYKKLWGWIFVVLVSCPLNAQTIRDADFDGDGVVAFADFIFLDRRFRLI